jgi:malate/lactate dehydrogenase
MRKVVICGQSQLTTAVIKTLIESSLPLELSILSPDVPAVASLELLSQMGHNPIVKLTAKGWGDVDALVVTDFGEATGSDFQQTMLDQLRKVMSTAMAAGFQGKVLIAAHEDAVLTYFAQRFSGLAKETVIGLGTFGLSACFERLASSALNVPRRQVTAYAVGTASQPVLLWSRAYVAATPLLALLPPVDGMANPLLTQVAEAVSEYAQGEAAIFWPALVQRVLAGFFGQPLLAPLTVISDAAAWSIPVLINENGAQVLAPMTAADAEMAALEAVKTTQAAQVAAIQGE